MSVLILNAGYEPLQSVSLQHAIKMVVRQVAVIEEHVEGESFGDFPMPRVLRLVKYVKMAWRNIKPRFSKNKLLKRDREKCAYCGKHATTLDHIIPRSRGGETSWLNTVAACLKCNHKKASRTPDEANMKLRVVPYEPTWYDIAHAVQINMVQ